MLNQIRSFFFSSLVFGIFLFLACTLVQAQPKNFDELWKDYQGPKMDFSKFPKKNGQIEYPPDPHNWPAVLEWAKKYPDIIVLPLNQDGKLGPEDLYIPTGNYRKYRRDFIQNHQMKPVNTVFKDYGWMPIVGNVERLSQPPTVKKRNTAKEEAPTYFVLVGPGQNQEQSVISPWLSFFGQCENPSGEGKFYPDPTLKAQAEVPPPKFRVDKFVRNIDEHAEEDEATAIANSQETTVANSGETLLFVLNADNKGQTIINGLILKDTWNKQFELIPDSIQVNRQPFGKAVISDNSFEIKLGEIKPGERIEVTYKMSVGEGDLENPDNKVSLTLDTKTLEDWAYVFIREPKEEPEPVETTKAKVDCPKVKFKGKATVRQKMLGGLLDAALSFGGSFGSTMATTRGNVTQSAIMGGIGLTENRAVNYFNSSHNEIEIKVSYGDEAITKKFKKGKGGDLAEGKVTWDGDEATFTSKEGCTYTYHLKKAVNIQTATRFNGKFIPNKAGNNGPGHTLEPGSNNNQQNFVRPDIRATPQNARPNRVVRNSQGGTTTNTQRTTAPAARPKNSWYAK